MSPVPVDPRIEAVVAALSEKRGWLEWGGVARVAVEAIDRLADAALTPPAEGDYGIYYGGKWVLVTLHVDPKDGSVKNVTTRDGAAVVSPPASDKVFVLKTSSKKDGKGVVVTEDAATMVEQLGTMLGAVEVDDEGTMVIRVEDVVSPPDVPSDESLDAMEAHAEYAAGFSDERGLLSGDVTRLLAEVRRLRVSPPDVYEHIGWRHVDDIGVFFALDDNPENHADDCANSTLEPVFRRVVRDENEHTK